MCCRDKRCAKYLAKRRSSGSGVCVQTAALHIATIRRMFDTILRLRSVDALFAYINIIKTLGKYFLRKANQTHCCCKSGLRSSKCAVIRHGPNTSPSDLSSIWLIWPSRPQMIFYVSRLMSKWIIMLYKLVGCMPHVFEEQYCEKMSTLNFVCNKFFFKKKTIYAENKQWDVSYGENTK